MDALEDALQVCFCDAEGVLRPIPPDTELFMLLFRLTDDDGSLYFFGDPVKRRPEDGLPADLNAGDLPSVCVDEIGKYVI